MELVDVPVPEPDAVFRFVTFLTAVAEPVPDPVAVRE
jgi:hypothetical protein